MLALGLCLAACGRDGGRTALQDPGAPTVAERVSVLAADTLVVDGRHVRLANAYTPESVPRARCWAEAQASMLAARVVQQMVREATSIEVRPTGPRDIYNREYAIVMLSGQDLGQVLYQEGLAAQPGPNARFPWCDPISQSAGGAPDIFSLMELKPR
ncbi:MAG: nuclease [Phenylobacterium sp.]